MPTKEEIAEQALSLPAADRAYVADLLEQSLRTGDFATAKIGAEWMTEIDRRIKAYERGEMPSEDWQIVMARLEAKHSASKHDNEH